VACPCALLLSATFTNGNILRYLGRYQFYAKNANAVERIANADTIVFDKTGTITYQQEAKLIYKGDLLNSSEQEYVKGLASQSNHPLSKAISNSLSSSKAVKVNQFEEVKGKGISAKIDGQLIQLGSGEFVGAKTNTGSLHGSDVYVSINGQVKGCFVINATYREGLNDLVKNLKKKYTLYIVSGDNANEQKNLQTVFGYQTPMFFEQKPEDKLNFIHQLQLQGKKVIMLGDGLNDAGALKQSDVGIAVTDDMNNFSPACDAIMNGNSFHKLNQFLNYCKDDKKVIIGSFIISILYNIIGLYFAVQGGLSPVIAAILMPVSSISIVLFTSISTWVYSLKLKTK
jgi:Cu+-exporting ATPase